MDPPAHLALTSEIQLPDSEDLLIMDSNTTFGFLDLPPEIRVMIYQSCFTSRVRPFFLLQGLYLSCQKVKTEMDVEGWKALCKFLKSPSIPSVDPAASSTHVLSGSNLSDLRWTISARNRGLLKEYLRTSSMVLNCNIGPPRSSKAELQDITEKIFGLVQNDSLPRGEVNRILIRGHIWNVVLPAAVTNRIFDTNHAKNESPLSRGLKVPWVLFILFLKEEYERGK
ncbi:hypothetical protein DM02DRAFT_711890 [Periconia macrospinosa]|uniref:Uncharacterized protein n=1 Tax=Periconia macrospinosa TaxID=97972 RepID=A0A2V1DMM8_9PLEO|nr:hypothetical protein DM02DRAFT_711890 [Periconia macrospinosa]